MCWQDKVKQVRDGMHKRHCDLYVVTALDEIAWLLNLRGSDIPYNPVFFAYIIVTMDDVCLFVDENKLDNLVLQHLGINRQSSNANDINLECSGSCPIRLFPYDAVFDKLVELSSKTDKNVLLSSSSSYKVYSAIDKNRITLSEHSPIAEMKCQKNLTEISGMRNCHIRDGAALCEFLFWLENEVRSKTISEYEAALKCDEFRSKQKDFVSLSFQTISSSGANSAVIHYSPKQDSSSPIVADQIYLVDSGAQYKDGTTDITRTVHMGTPTAHQRYIFTLVLKGHINLATAVFPNRVSGNRLDTLAREAMWAEGLDYLHGTGHGVGHFLNVHEGPAYIGSRAGRTMNVAIEKDVVITIEPGIYLSGQYGVRFENVFLVVEANPKNNFNDVGYLTFEPLSFAPIQRSLIDASMLNLKEVAWIDNYHDKCRNLIGPALKDGGKLDVFQWLMEQTEKL